jgi:hypothetical protein
MTEGGDVFVLGVSSHDKEWSYICALGGIKPWQRVFMYLFVRGLKPWLRVVMYLCVRGYQTMKESLMYFCVRGTTLNHGFNPLTNKYMKTLCHGLIPPNAQIYDHSLSWLDTPNTNTWPLTVMAWNPPTHKYMTTLCHGLVPPNTQIHDHSLSWIGTP